MLRVTGICSLGMRHTVEVASDFLNRPLDDLAIECEKRGPASFCPSIIALVQLFVNGWLSDPQESGAIKEPFCRLCYRYPLPLRIKIGCGGDRVPSSAAGREAGVIC